MCRAHGNRQRVYQCTNRGMGVLYEAKPLRPYLSRVIWPMRIGRVPLHHPRGVHLDGISQQAENQGLNTYMHSEDSQRVISFPNLQETIQSITNTVKTV